MKKFARVILAVAAFFVGIGITEIVLRAVDYHYSPVKIGTGVSGDFREEHAFHDRHLVYDPALIWRPVSHQFSPFNPQGFRGAPVVMPKPSGTYRIFALGDSNTFGWDVDEGANWPDQLQMQLKQHDPNIEVINAGVWGYTSFQGLARFKELIAFQPDMVLVSFGGNDAQQVHVPDDQYVRSHDRIDRVTRSTRRFRVAQAAIAGWDFLSMATAGKGFMPRVSLDDYRTHLREMIRLGREKGISVVLMTRPFIGVSDEAQNWKTHAPHYNAATLDIAKQEHVPVIDVFAAFHGREKLFDDESHFGVEGHREAAIMIRDAVLPLIKH